MNKLQTAFYYLCDNRTLHCASSSPRLMFYATYHDTMEVTWPLYSQQFVFLLRLHESDLHGPLELGEELSSTVNIYRLLRWLSDGLKRQTITIILIISGGIQMLDGEWDFQTVGTWVCFFGSGATDFEMLFTSLWTSENIWLRLSTFSFLTALICEARDCINHTHNTRTERMWTIYEHVKMETRSYMFECCGDGLRFVLGLQMLVCNLKDALLLFAFLFVLGHVAWRERKSEEQIYFQLHSRQVIVFNI